MISKNVQFTNSSTAFYFDAVFADLKTVVDQKHCIIITDENVFAAHQKKFKGWKTIVIPAGEAHKHQATVDKIVAQLIDYEADRTTTLVGVGGGVVTDITGYVAAVYMRGLSFGFVPTTVLGMVDAAIGGKNGIDVGLYKNMVGTIRQPNFLLYDVSMLKTLPHAEWVNGFAEIIKHACIADLPMFKQLQQHDIAFYQKKKADLQVLIERNAKLKAKVVQQDEFENANRKLLNFGHTLGHAIENEYQLPHGHAISIGMVYAAHFSARLVGFKQAAAVIELLEQYELPTHLQFDFDAVFEVLKMDKKRLGSTMNFILLNRLGRAQVHAIALTELKQLMTIA